MSNDWLPWIITITAAALGAAGLHLLTWWLRPVDHASRREERLTRTLARTVGCSAAEALCAVRRELEIAANQTDDTLLKRAAYHYRHELPEAPWAVYRDPTPG